MFVKESTMLFTFTLFCLFGGLCLSSPFLDRPSVWVCVCVCVFVILCHVNSSKKSDSKEFHIESLRNHKRIDGNRVLGLLCSIVKFVHYFSLLSFSLFPFLHLPFLPFDSHSCDFLANFFAFFSSFFSWPLFTFISFCLGQGKIVF